jgi:two-component sensor histidine kinase
MMTIGGEPDHRVRSNLTVLLELVRLQADFPPASAAAALSRVAGQIVTLSAIYDRSLEPDGEVDLKAWCETFVAAVAKSLPATSAIRFRASPAAPGPRMPLEEAQSLGLVLGELLADAHDRAARHGCPSTIIEVELERLGADSLAIRVRDGSPSVGLPRLTRLLATTMGWLIKETGSEGSTEREIEIPPRSAA